MSDEKLYTARDLILAKRQGYAARMWESLCMTNAEVKATIAARYPLPKKTRPRVVMDPHDNMIAYRLVGGNFEYCVGSGPWKGMGAIDEQWSRENYVSPKRVALWAALLANPTEEVDDAD